MVMSPARKSKFTLSKFGERTAAAQYEWSTKRQHLRTGGSDDVVAQTPAVYMTAKDMMCRGYMRTNHHGSVNSASPSGREVGRLGYILDQQSFRGLCCPKTRHIDAELCYTPASCHPHQPLSNTHRTLVERRGVDDGQEEHEIHPLAA
jgi:hypothetical protein